MQLRQLGIYYPPPGSGDRNMYNTMENRAGENSNNVFPYNVMWNYYRNFRNYTGLVFDDHMVGKVRQDVGDVSLPARHMHTLIPLRCSSSSYLQQDVFAALQSAYAQLYIASDPTTSVVVSAECSVLRSFAADSIYDTPAERHFEAIYWDPGYAQENGYRMGTLFQIVYLIAQQPHAYAGNLETGWPIVTLLYQATRQLDAWGRTNNTFWESKRSLLGLDLYPRVGGGTGIPYTSSEDVRSMIGNDFLVSWAPGS